MAKKKEEIPMLERFEKHAATKTEARRVYNIVEDQDFMHMSLEELLYLRGLGRKGALLVVEVACDLTGKK